MKRVVILFLSMIIVSVASGCSYNRTIVSADGPTDIVVSSGNTENITDSVSESITEINETEQSVDELIVETYKTAEENAPLPLYVYSGDDGIEKAVTEFFREADLYYQPAGSIMIPAFCFFLEESTEDDFPVPNDIKVYGNFWMFIYSKRERLCSAKAAERIRARYISEKPAITAMKSQEWTEQPMVHIMQRI